jgi:hypothetical protein
LFEKTPELYAKLFIAEIFIDTGTGLTDGCKIILITEYTRMKGPLPATPRSTLMHSTAAFFIIKNTMTVDNLHLYHLTGDPPVSIGNLFPAEAKFLYHALLVIMIKRNRGLTLTAIPATGTLKNFVELHCFQW